MCFRNAKLIQRFKIEKAKKLSYRAGKNFATNFSLLKSKPNVLKRHLSWDKTFVVWTSPLNSNTHLAVLLSRCVCYRQQCTAALCCDRMTVKYTHDEHGDMLLILGTCNSLVLVLVRILVLVLVPVLVLVLVQVLVPVPVPVPVLHNTGTLMRFKEIQQRLCETGTVNSYGTGECTSLTYRTDSSQWRRHNCSCGKRVTQLTNVWHKNYGCPNRGTSKYFQTIRCINTASALVFPD